MKARFWIFLGFALMLSPGSVSYAVPVHLASDEETSFSEISVGLDEEESSEEKPVVSENLLDFLNSAPLYPEKPASDAE